MKKTMKNFKRILPVVFLSISALLWGQTSNMLVTGNIFSAIDGSLVGAQILEIDENNRAVSATTSDYNGNFSIQIKNANNKLRIVYLGFTTQNLSIGDNRRFNVELKESNVIDEVVVSAKAVHSDGTLTIPQREITGAVQRISIDKMVGLSVPSVDDMLQGKIAGLDIVGNSGNLGAGSTLRIRGTTSINSNSEPLIVVNDVPYENNIPSSFDYSTVNQEQFANLLNISPDDIEEVTVLKDGASAAIWGAKGANGVICIRTKRGAKGPTRVQYSYRFSGKQQPQGINMLNGDDYTMMMKQAYFNPRQDVNAANIPEFNYNPTFSEYENFNNNVDWVKEITQYGLTHDHSLTVSGGGEKANFRLSLGYYGEAGTVIEQDLQRITNRMNLEYWISNRIRFSSDFAISYTNNHKNMAYDVGDSYNTENLLSMAYRKAPNVSVYQQDDFGNDTKIFYAIPQSSSLDASQRDLLNPVALAHLAKNDEENVRIMPKFSLRYDILDPEKSMLRYNGYISFDYENNDHSRFLPRNVTTLYWDNENVNRSYGRQSEALAIYSDQNLTYVPNLGEHHNLMLYASWQLSTKNSQNEELERYGLASELVTDPTLPGAYRLFKSGLEQERTMGLLGRIHYTLYGRYIVDLSMRRDASSRFGSNNRWGNFPAASVKWILSDESFMRWADKWMSEFGIRAGYGVTGNSPDKNYLYFSRYDGDWGEYGNNYINIPTIKPTSIRLANLKWETSSSYNLGFDLSLFDFRYNMDFNVYHRRTEDLLFPDQPIPGSSGFTKLNYINGGTMDNDGWEFNFYTNKMVQIGDWSFDINLNLSNYINQIVSLSPSFVNSYNTDFNYQNGSYLSRIQEGNALGSIYGFRYKGVYQYDKYVEGQAGSSPYARDADNNVIVDANGNPVPMYFAYGTTSSYTFRGGDAIYEDINHDGTIDELDIVYLGNCNPKLNGGFGATFRYKNLSVNGFFNFRYGNKILNRARMEAENMYSNNNQSIAVNWRWRKSGDLTEMPRALYDYGYNWLGSDRFVEDGSFLRLKNVTFAYEFDKKTIKSLLLNQLNLYLTLYNVFTVTKYTGVDPEVSPNMNPSLGMIGISEDKNKTPRAQYFTLGVTVGF
jgi:TonB-linked SusC/RagA family outer membrane protein